MIVDCAVYRRGCRLGGLTTPEEAVGARRHEPDAFVWIGLYEPTESEFESVRSAFDLHELAIEDAIKAHQRPKLEVYDDTLFMVLKPARYVDEDEDVEFGEILVFAGAGFLITVRHRPASALGNVRRRLEADREMLAHGPGGVLHAIVDHVVDDYMPVIAGLEKDIHEVEAQVFSTSRENPAERIYKLKREVLEFQLAAAPLLEPLDRLARHRVASVPGELTEYFRDVHDHLLRVVEQVVSFRELLTSILEANLTQVGVRQNEDMRKISAWVAILAVPTMIAGIYGMNFQNMPELSWRYGYPAALGVMVLICAGLWVFFRRSGWL
jgi:magnesium transporter